MIKSYYGSQFHCVTLISLNDKQSKVLHMYNDQCIDNNRVILDVGRGYDFTGGPSREMGAPSNILNIYIFRFIFAHQ